MGNICTNQDGCCLPNNDICRNESRIDFLTSLDIPVNSPYRTRYKLDSDRTTSEGIPKSTMEHELFCDQSSQYHLSSPPSDLVTYPVSVLPDHNLILENLIEQLVQEEEPKNFNGREFIAKKFRENIAKHENLIDSELDYRTRLSTIKYLIESIRDTFNEIITIRNDTQDMDQSQSDQDAE